MTPTITITLVIIAVCEVAHVINNVIVHGYIKRRDEEMTREFKRKNDREEYVLSKQLTFVSLDETKSPTQSQPHCVLYGVTTI